MKTLYKVVLIFSIIVAFSFQNNIFAQDNILSGMRQLPQYRNNNPAFQPRACVFVGFPYLSSTYLDLHHTGFTINDALEPMPNYPDSFYLDLKTLTGALHDNNYINAEQSFSLINFGFALKNGYYFTFDINTKFQERFKYPKSVLETLNGNYREDGTPLAYHFGANLNSYSEVAFGLSKKMYNGLTIGGRVKVLAGLTNVSLNKINLDLTTQKDGTNPDENFYDLTFASDIEIQASSIFPFKELTDSSEYADYFMPDVDLENIDPAASLTSFIPKNWGLALDLGVNYKINRQFSVSASLIDLGYIKWKTNARQLTQNSEFVFTGVDIGAFVGSIDDAEAAKEDQGQSLQNNFQEDLTNKLKETFKPEVKDEAYTSYLQSRFFVGGNWHATKHLDLNLLYRGHIYDHELHSAGTISANFSFFKGLALSTSYTIMDYNYNNVGLGFAYRMGPFQWYMMADNISPYVWAANDSKFSNNWIRGTKRVTLHAGFNLVFYCKTERGLLE